MASAVFVGCRRMHSPNITPLRSPPRTCPARRAPSRRSADLWLCWCWQWSGVVGSGWKVSPLGRNLFSEDELTEMQLNWENDAERSDLFRQALLLLRMDEFEDGVRSELYKCVKMIVEQEAWEHCVICKMQSNMTYLCM